LQGDRLRGAALAGPLDGDGHVHGLLPGEYRLAERLRRLLAWLDQPLVRDRACRAVGGDSSGHVRPAPVVRLLSYRNARHMERHMMDAPVEQCAAGREQARGERPACQPASAPRRLARAVGLPYTFRRQFGSADGQDGWDPINCHTRQGSQSLTKDGHSPAGQLPRGRLASAGGSTAVARPGGAPREQVAAHFRIDPHR
jgi:hypothetical protein